MSSRRAIIVVAGLTFGLCLPSSHSARAALPPGYDPTLWVDASTYGFNLNGNSTTALQGAIDSGKNVYVPNMNGTPWSVAPITLSHSNQTIEFQSGAVIAAQPNMFHQTPSDYSSLFKGVDIQNVNLIGYGATLQMRKDDYLNPLYYWNSSSRHGIYLSGVQDVTVKGLSIKDTGGDGICVSDSIASGTSQGVTIQDVRIDNALRNGISIITADGVTIDNAVITNTNSPYSGNPKLGIDLEPNTSTQSISNVTIKNSILANNGGGGIGFSPKVTVTENDPNPDTWVMSPMDNILIDHVTAYNNGGSGINQNNMSLPEVTIQNSLLVDNALYGVRGTTNLNVPGTDDPKIPLPTPYSLVQYSEIYSNTSGTTDGRLDLGDGLDYTHAPVFVSTDPSDPYYLYLDHTLNSTTITQGGIGGTYLGARHSPEPAALGLLALSSCLLLARRRGDMK